MTVLTVLAAVTGSGSKTGGAQVARKQQGGDFAQFKAAGRKFEPVAALKGAPAAIEVALRELLAADPRLSAASQLTVARVAKRMGLSPQSPEFTRQLKAEVASGRLRPIFPSHASRYKIDKLVTHIEPDGSGVFAVELAGSGSSQGGTTVKKAKKGGDLSAFKAAGSKIDPIARLKASRRQQASLKGGETGGWTPEKVKALRRSYGETQLKFGQRLGTTQAVVARWETGAFRPSRMARLLLDTLAASAPPGASGASQRGALAQGELIGVPRRPKGLIR